MPLCRPPFLILALLVAGATCFSACTFDSIPSPQASEIPTHNATPWPKLPLPTLTRHQQLKIEQDASSAYPETCQPANSGCQTRHELAQTHQCRKTGTNVKEEDLLYPSSLFGAGLTPAYPIAVCSYFDQSLNPAPEAAIFSKSLSWPFTRHFATWYLARTPSGVVRLNTETDFRRRFAPVESPAEALAFVLALKEDTIKLEKSYLDQLPLSSTHFVAATAEETRVEADGENWKVLNVLRHSPCGQLIERIEFGAVPGYAVDYRVGHDGLISEISKRLIFVNVNCPDE